ncbi:unnamed protein product [Adineta steineri]|uniref:Uncharacterized protein n=1 Tax=Adineta steineri TaxID=433720 RepID=A0A814YS91_9BILA|nr:unnamed protein product [Adineta steineri]
MELMYMSLLSRYSSFIIGSILAFNLINAKNNAMIRYGTIEKYTYLTFIFLFMIILTIQTEPNAINDVVLTIMVSILRQIFAITQAFILFSAICPPTHPYFSPWIRSFLSHPIWTPIAKLRDAIAGPLLAGALPMVLIVPSELTLSGDHRVDQITLGSHTNLANGCSILPGSCLASETMIGNITRISRETKSKYGEVFMGIPARIMPFQMPVMSTVQDQIEIIPFWHTCLSHYVSKCLLLCIYSFGGLVGGSIIHTMLVCGLYRCRAYIRYQIIEQIITRISQDHAQFICPFLGNTQWLIRLFRAYGAHIGDNNIVPDISSITDYHLMTIGDNVRVHVRTEIQGHSFEQRILKLAPVSIDNSCVLMSYSVVMAGCKLMG